MVEDISERFEANSYTRGNVRVTETRYQKDGNGKMTVSVLETTNGDKDVDLRVGEVRAGNWFLFLRWSYAAAHGWVSVEGDAVRAKAGAR